MFRENVQMCSVESCSCPIERVREVLLNNVAVLFLSLEGRYVLVRSTALVPYLYACCNALRYWCCDQDITTTTYYTLVSFLHA